MRSPAWRAILLWTLVGTVGGVGLCLLDLSNTRDTLGGLVAAVPGTPLDAQQRADGLTDRAAGGGHDGSQFYAIARNPFDLDAHVGELDRPRYRLQRILFPVVAWALHPTGGGPGLVWTMFAVLVAGMVLGGMATGTLAYGLRGPPWPAAIFAPMFGSIVSLRITTPDALALALAITAITLSLYRRPALATVVAVAAVLTREPLLLMLGAFALWRRDRDGVVLVAVPAAVAGAWYLFLAWRIPGPVGVSEFVMPLTGWRDSVEFWRANVEGPMGLLSALAGLILAGFALVRTRPSHPLWLPIAASCGALVFYSVSVLAPERNASRVFLPIQILSIVALTTRGAERGRLLGLSRPQRAGRDPQVAPEH